MAQVALLVGQAPHPARPGTVQHHQPVHRTDEFGVALTPAHQLRDRKRLERLLHEARKVLGQRLTRLACAEYKVLGFAILHPLELVGRHAAGSREALERLGRLAVGSQPSAHRGALAFDRLLWLLGTHAVDQNPSRRGVA